MGELRRALMLCVLAICFTASRAAAQTVELGASIGVYRDRELVTCEPSGCESQLARIGLSAGETRESHLDESLVVGLSVLPYRRVRVYGGWRYHNPFRDELALSEVFVALGFRPF